MVSENPKSSVVLLSGGLDSSVLLAKLVAEKRRVLALGVDYGQRHAREIDAARAVCAVKDVVIARDRRLASPSGLRFPAGASAYSDTGETLGTVCDYRMDEDAPALVICSGSSVTEIPANRAAAGESVIVYPDAAPKRTASGAPRTKRKAQRHAHAREETPHAPDVASDSLAPPVNHLDLLGRTVKRTVYGANGEALIPAGTRILPPVLLLARRHGRLLSLAVNTLTNLP